MASKTALLIHETARQKSKDTKERDGEIVKKLLARLFLQQREFVLDRSRFKAALCPRRGGKSYAVLIYALVVGLLRPGARVLILARVRRQARSVYWHTLQQLAGEFELRPKALRNMLLECELNNGSLIQFAGADTEEEIDKYRGAGYDLVCIDECKSYSESLLNELIEEIITPALIDRLGTLVMIGTPGAIPAGRFWAVTTQQKTYRPPGSEHEEELRVRYWPDRKPGQSRFLWSFHTWTAKDNVNCPWIWEDCLRIKEQKGYADDHPVWLREFCGRWIADHDSLVYAYHRQPEKIDWRPTEEDYKLAKWGLPAGHAWRFILGVDLGFKDASAFVVAAWSETHPKLHYVHAERHSGMVAEDVVKKTLELEQRYGRFDAKIADAGGLGTFAIEGMNRTHGVYFEAAKKSDKPGHIALLNSDLTCNRVQVHIEGCHKLLDEWRVLQWADPEHKKEDPGCDNHCSDAALYVWRYAYHHWSREREKLPEVGSDAWWKAREADERKKAMEQIRQDRLPFWKKLRGKADKLPESAWISRLLNR